MCVMCPSFGVGLQAKQNKEIHQGTGLRNIILSRAGQSTLEVNNILCGLPPATQVIRCGNSEVLAQQKSLTCD